MPTPTAPRTLLAVSPTSFNCFAWCLAFSLPLSPPQTPPTLDDDSIWTARERKRLSYVLPFFLPHTEARRARDHDPPASVTTETKDLRRTIPVSCRLVTTLKCRCAVRDAPEAREARELRPWPARGITTFLYVSHFHMRGARERRGGGKSAEGSVHASSCMWSEEKM